MAKEMIGGCCVCSDERGWAENPLVYCDGHGCNVAVHQACYGIVTVPTGPWFCRKCESQERAARVRCELCPHREGALKRTDGGGGWAHVVCALYIPEVRFGNVTTMEPILLSLVPNDRYNKICYICEHQHRESKASTGACMTCNKNGCRQSFHVTCAQMQGLLCEEAGQFTDNVKYCGYCEYHYNKLKKDKETIKTIPAFKHHYTTTPEKEKVPEKKHEKHKQRKKHAVSTEASVVTQTEYEKTRTEVLESMPATSSSSLKCLEETAAKFTSANFTETEFTSNKPILEPSPTGVVTPPVHKPKKHSGQRGRKPGSSKSSLLEIASASGRSDSPSSTASQPDLPGLGLPEINAINSTENRATPSDDASSTKSKTKSQARSSKEPSREPTPSRMPSVTTETIEHKDLPPITTSTSTPPPISVDTNLATMAEAMECLAGKTYESSYHDFMRKYSQGVQPANPNAAPPPHRQNKEPTVSPITIVKSPDKHDKKKHRVKKNKAHPGRPKSSAKTVKDLINESSQPSPKKSRKSSASSLNSSVNTVNSSSFNFNVNEINAIQSGPLPPNLVPQGSPTRHLAASQSSTSTLGLSSMIRACGESSLSGSINSSLSQQMYGSQLGMSHSSMPSLVPENPELAASQGASDTAFRDVFNTAVSNGLLLGPQRQQSHHNSLQRTTLENSGTVPPFPATMEELLERQWEQGSEFLMQQGAHFDIASLLSCLHQLRAENQRLEEHIKNLLARRDHLLAVNARLSVPLGNSIGSAGGSNDNSPNGPTGRSPRINNLIHPDTPQGHSQDLNTSHGSVSQTSRSPGTSIHSNSPGQGSQPPQLPVAVPTGPLAQVPTTPPHPQAPSLQPQQQTTTAAAGVVSMPGQMQGNHNPVMQPPAHSGPPSAVQQPPAPLPGQMPDGRVGMPTHHQESPPDAQRYREQHMRESSKELQVREQQRQQIMIQQQHLNTMLQQQQLTPEQHQQLVFQLMHHHQQPPPVAGQAPSGVMSHAGGNGPMPHIQLSPQGGGMPVLHVNGEHSGLPPDAGLSKAPQGKKGSSSHGNKS